MTAQHHTRAGGNSAGHENSIKTSASTGSLTSHPGTLSAALRYARKGLAVFPLQPGAKVPYTGGHGHLDATADVHRLMKTWPAPDANVAIATGARSGVWVLDVDLRHDGFATIHDLLEHHANEGWDNAPVVKTPGDGKHYWFRYPADGGVPCSAGKIGPGVDVRGDGGYVVVPPSRLGNGRDYRWVSSSRRGLTDAPAWLLALAAERTRCRRFAESVAGTIDDGRRNVSLTSLAGSMRDRGCEADEIEALLRVANTKRCEPPLTDREVHDIVASVMRYAPGKAWWAVGESEDAAAEEWLASTQHEAAARFAARIP